MTDTLIGRCVALRVGSSRGDCREIGTEGGIEMLGMTELDREWLGCDGL
jgi:hypothetical protein